MATISSTLRLFDSMTSPIRNITQSMNLMISAMDRMQRSANQNVNIDRTLVAARRQLAVAETELTQAINQSNQAQERFNRTSQSGASSIISQLKGIGAAYLSIQAIQKAMAISDNYISAQARLGLINDGSQTMAELQEKIFAAANRSRGDYGVMASSAGKLGLLAGDAFSNNNEIIKFTELMQKSFKVSGSSTMEQQAGMYQLTQAMAAGKLQGDEFRSIMENAPMLANAIADFAGKSKGELKKMSADGTITADIIKGALFSAADDINEKFKTMPMTFSDVTTRLKNEATQAFAPVIERINELVNSPGGAAFINNLITQINILAYALNGIVLGLIWIGTVAQNNWGIIEPIIWGIVGALIAYNATMGIAWFTTLKDLAVKGAHTIASWAETSAIIALTLAQEGLNAALALCPITWIIIAGIALIVVFYAAVAAVNKFAGTSLSATGIIAGAFMVAAAFIGNVIVAAVNLIIDCFVVIWNFIASFAEFFANVFNDPVGSIVRLFASMGDSVLGILEGIASGIDTIFGSNLANAVNGWRSGLKSSVVDLVGEAEIKIPRLDSNAFHLDRFNYGNAYKTGYSFGNKVSDKLSLSNLLGADALTTGSNLVDGIPNIGKVGEVGKIKDTVDISSEDLKVMRELAEIKSIQNFVTLTPTVRYTHSGDVKNGESSDVIIDKIKILLEKEIASSTEGVYS